MTTAVEKLTSMFLEVFAPIAFFVFAFGLCVYAFLG